VYYSKKNNVFLNDFAYASINSKAELY